MTKTDARSVTTTFAYDALSRVLTRSYSDGITPTVVYTYDDVTVPFGKGKLTKVTSSVSETSYTGFDALGRLLSNKQTTDGAAYQMSYSYNLAGALTSQTYPSGRVVTNSFDNDGQLTNVSSKATSTATPRTYANAFVYAPSGAVQSMRLGNGRFESTVFNSRLQPIQIALGTSATNTSLLKLNYDYGTTDNNGNVKSQTVTVPQMSNPLVQNYSYDSLNRITEAKETSNGSQQWIQSFTYDRYGNRRIDSATNKTTSSLVGPNPVISETNNRIVAQQGEQYLYDSTGNLTRDKDGNTFVYDAENKQVTYRQAGSVTDTAYYAYDGNGQRVRKIFNSITTIFIYDASGKLVEEYETTTPPTNGKIQYTTQDTLGSPRVLTDASGQVTSRRDFLPFGEEIASGIGGRNTAQGYGGQDSIRQKFTGYQRDTESGLDFAQARYYSSQLGRFSSADPLMASGRAEMPQSWNRYAYVLNNPLKFNDPTGLSEQGGTMIKHPDNRMVKINTDEILTVYIQTKPANPVNGRGISGEDVFRYDTEVTVTNEKGEVVPSESTLYFFDVRDQRRQNFDLATGEPKTIVEEVDIDYEGVSAPEKRSVTVEVKGEKKDIDYKIQNVGNTVQVVQDSYDNKITIPGVPTFIGVPVSRNKPDPIVESMRPKQPGTTLALNGY